MSSFVKKWISSITTSLYGTQPPPASENSSQAAVQEPQRSAAQTLDPLSHPPFQASQHPFSQKLFALILDDHAIKDTSFEGANFLETIGYMNSLLKANEGKCAKLGLHTDTFIKKFEKLSFLAQDLDQLLSQKRTLTPEELQPVLEALKKIAEKVAVSVKELQPNQSILIPGGWSSKNGTGHATLYEVKKNNTSSYSFSVYNTGEGLEHHPKMMHGLKEKYQGVIEIENISENNITSVNFYKSLFEIHYLNLFKNDHDEPLNGPNALYTGLLKALGGVEKVQDSGKLSYRSSQRSGTCAWKALMEGLRQSCSSYGQYRKLKYLVQCQALVDFIEHLKTIDPNKLEAKERLSLEHLIKISSEKTAKSLTKSFDHGYISNEELSLGYDLLEKLREQHSTNQQDLRIKQAESFESATCAMDNYNLTVKEHAREANIEGGMPPFLEPLDFADDASLDRRIQAYWDISCKLDYYTGHRVLEILTKEILKLPVPSHSKDPLWPDLTEQELLKKSAQIEKILMIYAALILRVNPREEEDKRYCGQASPKMLLVTYHLVAILDQLARRSHGNKLPSSSVYIGSFPFATGPGFVLPTKKLKEYRAAIDTYFDLYANQPRLFAFECERKRTNSDSTYTEAFGMLEDFSLGAPAYPEELSHKYSIDYEYLENCLKDPNILEKLQRKGIQDKQKQIQALINDFGELLPPMEGHLKKGAMLALLVQYQLRATNFPWYERGDQLSNQFRPFSKSKSTPEDSLYSILPTAHRSGNKTRTYNGHFTSSRDNELYFRILNHYMVADHHEKIRFYKDHYTDNYGSCLWQESKERLEMSPEMVRELSHLKLTRSGYDTLQKDKEDSVNEIVLQNQKSLTKLSFEQGLHIHLMNVDEQDAPWRLLSFLEKYPEAFAESGVQVLLLSYLYHLSTLIVLETQPLFAQKLKEQILRMYEVYKQNGDIPTAAFLVQYLKRLEGCYEEIHLEKSLFNGIDYEEKLLELKGLADSFADTNSITTALALLYYQDSQLQKPFKEEMVLDILKANMFTQWGYFNRLYPQELKEIQVTYHQEIQKYFQQLNPTGLDKVLNKLLEGREPATHWTGSYPDYFSEDHRLHLNVIRASYLINGKEPESPKKKLPTSTLLRYGLSENSPINEQHIYHSEDGQKRIFSHYGDEAFCEHLFEGRWQRFQNIGQNESFKPFLEAASLHEVAGYYTFSKNSTLPDEKTTTICLLANSKGDPLYEAVLEAAETSDNKVKHVIKKIQKKVGQKTYHLVNPENFKADTVLSSFFRIWIAESDPSDQILEITNSPLSLKKVGDYYESIQYPGYILANPQEEPLFGFTDYIYLAEKEKNQEKVVVFSPEPSKEKKQNFFGSYTFKPFYKVFDLDIKGKPIAKTSKDAVWLSHISLLGRNYEATASYLSRAEEMGIADKLSIEILTEIVNIADNHPDAINCRMQAACLIKKDSLLHSNNQTEEEKQNLAESAFKVDLYLEYLATLGKGFIPPLDISLERLLWKNLSSKYLNEEVLTHFVLMTRQSSLTKSNSTPALIPLPPLKPSKPFERRIEDSVYRDLMQNNYPKIQDKDLIPYIGAGKLFREHFLSFYKEAAAQCDQEEKPLLPRVLAMQGDPDEKNRYLAQVLEAILLSKSAEDIKETKEIAQNIDSPKSDHKALLKKILDNFSPLSRSKAASLPSLTTFEKELSQETIGLSNTEAYRTQAERVVQLPDIQQTALFTQEIQTVNEELLLTIQEKKEAADKQMQEQKALALSLADKLPKESNLGHLVRMKRLGGDEKTLSIEELIGLFILGMQTSYLSKTYLTQQEVLQLDNAIAKYLQQKIIRDQAESSIQLYQEYKRAKKEEQPHLANQLLALINQKPQYQPSQHREYLAFEAMTGLRLHKEQIENLDLLSFDEQRSVVLHMIMGAGKSSVITPITAFLMARHNFLPLIVVPDSLYQTGKETTKLDVFEAFGTHAHPFEITRNTEFSKEFLQTLADSLTRWKKEKGFIYTTRESLLSFLLKAKELLYQYEEVSDSGKKELEESIELAWSILKELKQSSAALLDEAHSLLNCREELNFTFGNPKQIPSDQVDTIFDIVQTLIQDPKLVDTIGLLDNNQAKLSHKTYETKIKPIILKKLTQQFHIAPADQTSFKSYMTDQAEQIPSWIATHPYKDQIALSKALIQTFIPHTLTRKCDEHYGLGSKYDYCIPYLGNNTPNEKAEFAHYVETLLYTGYYYLQQGLTTAQLKEFKKVCLEKARKEQSASFCFLTETKVNAFFKKVTGQDLSLLLDIEKAKAHLKLHPEAVLDYCKSQVAPQIRIFPKKLGANPHNMVAMVSKANAMTGTPWNKHTYPSQFSTKEDLDIEEKSAQIVKSIPNKEIVPLQIQKDQQALPAILAEVAKRSDCRALIDTGALIKDHTNYSVAKEILAKTDPNAIDGVVYYDEYNELQILERKTGNVVLFKDSTIPKERRFTYYDDRHSLGSHVDQAVKARAVATLSETLKKFKLFQGMWRMRKIATSQKLTLVFPISMQHLITDKANVTSHEVLEYVENNQVQQEHLDNFRARKLEIKSIVEEAIHDALMQTTDLSTRMQIFSKTKHLLIESLDIAPFAVFGGIDKEVNAEEHLLEYTDKWLGILQDLAKQSLISNPAFYEEKIISLRPIPLNSTCRVKDNSMIDTQVQIESHVETQVEMEVELTTATESKEFFQPGIKPWAVRPWPEDLNIFEDDLWNLGLCHSVKDILAESENTYITAAAHSFDEKLLISHNFLPRSNLSEGEIPAEPFAWYAKPIYHLVVTQDASGEIKTLIIDQNDLPFFRNQLLKDQGNHQRKICICDPSLGVILQGENPLQEEVLYNNPSFKKHLVQAKFWNGEVNYPLHEHSILKQWIKDSGASLMQQVFQEILRYKDDTLKIFPNSSLMNIFKQLADEGPITKARPEKRSLSDDESVTKVNKRPHTAATRSSRKRKLSDDDSDEE